MNLLNFKRSREEDEFNFETNDFLIIFDDEKKTSDIKRVTDVTTEHVTAAPFHKVPIQDCEITNGSEGRNFFYRAPTRSIVETERLAQLEKSIVLTQITHYKPPIQPSSIDWMKGLLFATLIITILALAFN